MRSINSVNSEIFVRVLFSRKFAKFRENKNPAKCKIFLLFIDAGKLCPSDEFLMWQVFF